MGPVGVGKSTQLRLLKNYLGANKKLTVTTLIKSTHIFAYLLNSALRLLGFCENVKYPDGTYLVLAERRIVHRLLPLYSFLDVISIAIKFFFRVYVPFLLGFTVLIEEGPVMTLHTYYECYPDFFRNSPSVVRFSRYLISWLSSKPHLYIALDATDKQLVERRAKRSFRRTETPTYVISQRKWIRSLNLNEIVFIDTYNVTESKVHCNIVDLLEERLTATPN